jgi:hypothetical protein
MIGYITRLACGAYGALAAHGSIVSISYRVVSCTRAKRFPNPALALGDKTVRWLIH